MLTQASKDGVKDHNPAMLSKGKQHDCRNTLLVFARKHVSDALF